MRFLLHPEPQGCCQFTQAVLLGAHRMHVRKDFFLVTHCSKVY